MFNFSIKTYAHVLLSHEFQNIEKENKIEEKR